MAEYKQCHPRLGCGFNKPITEFNRNNSGDGYYNICKSCDRARRRANIKVHNLAAQMATGRPRGPGSPWEETLTKEQRKYWMSKARLELEANSTPTTSSPAPREKFTHPQLPRIEEEQKKRYADADTAEARARDGFVYVIYHDIFPDRVKIGKARNPNKRLADANTWCPDGEFKLHDAVYDDDAMTLERAVHAAAKARSTQLDGEWFEMNRWHAANLIRKVQRHEDRSSGGHRSQRVPPCRGHDLAGQHYGGAE